MDEHVMLEKALGLCHITGCRWVPLVSADTPSLSAPPYFRQTHSYTHIQHIHTHMHIFITYTQTFSCSDTIRHTMVT